MGRVNVATPGTPVRLTADPEIRVARLFVQVIPGLTGKGYVGKHGSLNKETSAGVARILWPNTSGGISDQFGVQDTENRNTIQLSDYAIDMDVAGEGLLITYWIA